MFTTLTPVTPENVTKSPAIAPLDVARTFTMVVADVNVNTAGIVVDRGVKEIPCSVQDYVFQDINTDEHSIIYAGVNLDFSEVNWFYASGSSTAIG